LVSQQQQQQQRDEWKQAFRMCPRDLQQQLEASFIADVSVAKLSAKVSKGSWAILVTRGCRQFGPTCNIHPTVCGHLTWWAAHHRFPAIVHSHAWVFLLREHHSTRCRYADPFYRVCCTCCPFHRLRWCSPP
jgi:hypothetical protein